MVVEIVEGAPHAKIEGEIHDSEANPLVTERGKKTPTVEKIKKTDMRKRKETTEIVTRKIRPGAKIGMMMNMLGGETEKTMIPRGGETGMIMNLPGEKTETRMTLQGEEIGKTMNLLDEETGKMMILPGGETGTRKTLGDEGTEKMVTL